MGNLFIFFTNNLYKFTLLLHISKVTKPYIKTIQNYLNHINVNSTLKLISMSTKIEIYNNILNIFNKTYIFVK